MSTTATQLKFQNSFILAEIENLWFPHFVVNPAVAYDSHSKEPDWWTAILWHFVDQELSIMTIKRHLGITLK